jgi:hypothetical protein
MKNLTRKPALKSAALLCIIVVSTLGAVFAGVTLTNRNFGNTKVIQTGENSADQVTIYGNGITFINYGLNTTLEQGTSTIQFYLPPNTLTDTLTVSGISVVEITTNEESQPLIEKGDVITVYTQDATYTGKFIGWDNMLLLEANNGTVMIPGDKITRISLSEVAQIQGPRILVEVTTNSPPGMYSLKISYLMRGPKWKPAYHVDLNTSQLDCWATIENVENWDNFTLVLVSGGPHLVIEGPIYFPAANYALSMYGEMVDFTPTTTDEYHEYTYNGKLSFENGTTVRLPMFNGTVTLRQEYFWSSGKVQNRYHITNTLAEPLASGTIEFYRGNKWMGEDSIAYTPMNGDTTAIVNYAEDITVNSTVTKSVNEGNHQVQGTEITIQNHKTTNIQITIQQDINGYTLDTCTPPAIKVGSTLTWTVHLNAGDKATIYYEWEHNW